MNAAKIKLGNDDVDTSDQEKIESLSNDLEAVKAQLAAENKKVDDYKQISQASEQALADSTMASNKLRKSNTAEIETLKSDLRS